MTETIICAECGTEVPRNPYSPHQKYCSHCRGIVEKRKLKESRERRKEEPAKEVAHRGSRKKAPTKQISVPSMVPKEAEGWSTKGKSLALVDAEAREFGMSYGKYMAAIQSGSIEQILRAQGLSEKDWKAKLRAAKKKLEEWRKLQ